MVKLIYIKASPRKERSYSTKVANQFIDAYRTTHPHDSIEELNLWQMDLPPFDGDTINAKYAVMHQQAQTPAQQIAWQSVTAMFEQFNSADKYLFSIPMWNFSIPYRLKHYIDLLTQPGLAFNIASDGSYVGLVTQKPAVLIYSSGGAYGPNSGAESYDMQKSYMKLWLQIIGFKDIRELAIESTINATEGQVQNSLKKAEEMAKNF